VIGVYSESEPAAGHGTGGYFKGGDYGVKGVVTNPDGLSCYGVYGSCEGTASDNNYGVFGYATSGAAAYTYGVFGSSIYGPNDYAGYFNADVHVDGTLTGGKGASKIDHPLDPENKYLIQSFVESPEMKTVYDGVATLDSGGEAWIELPDWFEALNGDFRYQLTCIGGFAPVYVDERIKDNRFRIAGGEPGMDVSWQVTGIRHDRFAVEHALEAEPEKSGRERGKYLHPEAYGLPRSLSVSYDITAEAEAGGN
jgi:hypothetical protein